jgi:hypothetical protein
LQAAARTAIRMVKTPGNRDLEARNMVTRCIDAPLMVVGLTPVGS